ncbi:MAG: EAL domain-containing protein [Dehalococcoidia bacterium]|nr:EAL domain-containing protein [Dehalococcoidia bacterium]MCA9830370.1 EAL domain-containing protein [Dehalococcoidia bacterium]MCB9486559.1 EAL domain-containing protein [Thermoflexaceae bacterium]
MQAERPGPQGDQPGEREPARWSTSNEATAPDADAYRRRYLELFNGANDIIYTHDLDGVFTSVNAAGLRITGYAAAEVIGHPYSTVVAPDHLDFVREITLQKLRGEEAETRYEIDILAKGGARIRVEVSSKILERDGRPFEVLGIARDIRDRQEHERRLRFLATHDPLTNLPNRRTLETAVEWSAQSGTGGVLAFIDLDNFKVVNDTMGHAAGDEILVAVTRVLSGALEPGDLLVRLGGDEFAVLFASTDRDHVSRSAESVRRAIEQHTFRVGEQGFWLGASIGLAQVETGGEPGSALAAADAAMYAAKSQGRNRVVWNDTSGLTTGKLKEESVWAFRIRSALDQGKFVVHYQPAIDLHTGKTVQHEALVRMRSDRGLISPSAFLAAAESSGLIASIDRVVFRTVVRQLGRSPGQRVFMNISGRSLTDPEFHSLVEQALKSRPELGPCLGFEITETLLLQRNERAHAWMRAMAGAGCTFALDDFGTSFSSLNHVSELPVHQIKLDGTFTREMHTSPARRAVVTAIRALAEGLGMTTVAESIDSPEILDTARAHGIQLGQGYLLGAPGPFLADDLMVA